MLSNKVVVISGGAGRLGSACAKAIVDQGGKVFVIDVIEGRGQKLVREFGDSKAYFLLGDVCDTTELNAALEKCVDVFGKIDAAIHCAYPTSSQWGTKFEDLQPDALKEDLYNQLGSAIMFSQQALYHFKDQEFGNLIHISSIQGINSPKFWHYEDTDMVSPIEYSAIKSGVISITKYLAKYYAGQNIRVNCVSPGGILDGQPNLFLDRYRSSCNNKGMLESNDIVGAIVFLLSDASMFITGQNIVVDDGWSL